MKPSAASRVNPPGRTDRSLIRRGFAWFSKMRGGRGFHQHGVRLYGTVRVSPDGPLAAANDGADVMVRLSKGGGLPANVRDVLGLSVRSTGPRGPWDLTLVSAGTGRVGRMIFRPAGTWGGTTFSSLAPYRGTDGLWWLLAHLDSTVPSDAASPHPVRTLIERGGSVRLTLLASTLGGEQRPAAQITLDRAEGDTADLGFDPMTNPPPGLQLVPQWLSRLRELAYQGSRSARDASAP